MTATKVCLGPGTEIQGTGSLFCRKIGPPICWDFFADLGGGVQVMSAADLSSHCSARISFLNFETPHAFCGCLWPWGAIALSSLLHGVRVSQPLLRRGVRPRDQPKPGMLVDRPSVVRC